MDGNLLTRLSASAEAGLVSRKYTHTVTGQPNDWATGRFMGSITWDGPMDFQVTLNGSRGANESSFSRYNFGNMVGLNVKKALGRRTEVSVLGSYNKDVYPGLRTFSATAAPARRIDVTTSGGVGAKFQATPKIGLGARYLYRARNSRFDPFDYKDSTISLSSDFIF